MLARTHDLPRSSKVLSHYCLTLLLALLLAANVSGQANAASCGENTGVNDCQDSSESSDPGSAPNPYQPSSLVGNPVNLITGNKYQSETDFRSSATRLVWSRHYNSANAQFDFGLGRGWSATFLALLQTRNNEGASLVQSNGRLVQFKPPVSYQNEAGETSNRWHAHQPSDGILHSEEEFTVWSLPDGRTLRFKGRLLVQIDFPGHAFLKLFYSKQRLASVSDELGQQLRFNYYPASQKLSRYTEPTDADSNELQQGVFGEAAARLKNLTLPNGSTIDYDYDSLGNLTRARFADGTSRRYHYENPDLPHHLSGVTNRLGEQTATWAYNLEGYATGTERADGIERTELTYHHPPVIGGIGTTSITNSLGEQSLYTWQRFPDQGQTLLLSSSGAGCQSCPPVAMQYTYTDEFQLASARHDSGRATRWKYDDYGRTTAVYQVATDGNERLLQEMTYTNEPDASGAETILIQNKPASIRYPSINPDAHHEVTFTYNEDGLPTSITESGYSPELNIESLAGTESNTLPDVVGYKPISRTTSFSYQDGRLVRVDGPRTDVQDIVTLSYYSHPDSDASASATATEPEGALRSIELASGELIALGRYNSWGQATELVHNNSAPYQLEYDENQQLISITHHGTTLRYHRDSEGKVTGITDANGRHTAIDYDASGRLTGMTDDVGQKLQWFYDTESRRTGEHLTGANGDQLRMLSMVYDQIGQLSSRTAERQNYSSGNTLSLTTVITYDNTGRAQTEGDNANDRLVNYEWNPFGELLAVTTPFSNNSVNNSANNNDQSLSTSSSTSRFSYGTKGRIKSLTDARNNTTTYFKDDFNRQVAEHSPDNGILFVTLDEAGNVLSSVNADNEETTFTYNSANRPLTKTNREGTTTNQYHPETGRLVQTSNQHTTETFEYDRYGQLTSHSRLIDEHNFTTTYEYDQRGRLLRKGLPDGTGLRYHYYADFSETGDSNAGQLRAITKESWFGLLQETLIGEIDQDARDGTTRHINHNGSITEKKFHPDGTLDTLEISDGIKISYEFGDDGRLISIDKNQFLSRFGYLNGRLSQATTPQGIYSYQYDELGNRTDETRLSDTGDVTHREFIYSENGQGNRLLQVDSNEYKYNSSGSTTQAGQFRYEYNTDQRPVRVYDGVGLLAEYSYNSFGERIKKVVYNQSGSTVTYFLYDGHQLTGEVNPDHQGNSQTSYKQTIYLGHAPVAYLDGENTYTVNSDHLGTPQQVSDSDNLTVWSADYSAFGETRVNVESIEFRHRFPGQYFDSETGTHYNYFRDYDPTLGRYLSSDPAGIFAGQNRYNYVRADPIGQIDPLGLWSNGQTLTPQQIQGLDGNPEAIRNFVTEHLHSFDDRQHFYQWAHNAIQDKPDATPTQWFQLASDVNRFSNLGGASVWPLFSPLTQDTRNLLIHAGIELAVQNVQTFIDIYNGRNPHPTQCLTQPALDEYLAQYEQESLTGIITDYLQTLDNGEGVWQGVTDDLNSLLNGSGPIDGTMSLIFSDNAVDEVVDTLFENQFDFSNEQHRINLAFALARMQNNLEWNNPLLYEW